MLHTAHHKVGTVNHTAVAKLNCRLWVSHGGFIANIYLIIIVKVLLFVVTVLRFHVWQDKRKMGIAVSIFIDSSLNSSRVKNVKFTVPSDYEVNIFFLSYMVIPLTHHSQNNCTSAAKSLK